MQSEALDVLFQADLAALPGGVRAFDLSRAGSGDGNPGTMREASLARTRRRWIPVSGGFMSHKDSLGSQFDQGLERLQDFVCKYGHARVPPGHIERGLRLNAWMVNRRAEYRAGNLPLDRKTKLEAVPGWTWDPRSDHFERGMESLMRFVGAKGHARVPRKHFEGNFALGVWVGTKRCEYHENVLSTERQARLEAVPGWAWDARDGLFDEAIRQLRDFADRHGHVRIPQSSGRNGFDLGTWARNQRTAYKKGRMTRENQLRLEAISAWTWDPHGERFDTGYRHLMAFVERNGHAGVPREHIEDGFKLGIWVDTRRREYFADKLSSDHARRLAEVRGWTWGGQVKVRPRRTGRAAIEPTSGTIGSQPPEGGES